MKPVSFQGEKAKGRPVQKKKISSGKKSCKKAIKKKPIIGKEPRIVTGNGKLSLIRSLGGEKSVGVSNSSNTRKGASSCQSTNQKKSHRNPIIVESSNPKKIDIGRRYNHPEKDQINRSLGGNLKIKKGRGPNKKKGKLAKRGNLRK